MSKKQDIDEGPINLSFEERSVWIQLASLGAILIGYGTIAGLMLLAGVIHIVPYVPVFALAVVLLIVLMIVGHAVTAATSRLERRDERDKLIVWRAESGEQCGVGVGRRGIRGSCRTHLLDQQPMDRPRAVTLDVSI
ncbi:MAG: hypothetical protein GWQ05_18740 [Verrucomicrobiaceae bacterium]|nr:hypothetical protein [Verrucomicrobiaceae bacterium]NCF92969.1 hypothetical protein [Verrucomicrobiaceae bacterium]